MENQDGKKNATNKPEKHSTLSKTTRSSKLRDEQEAKWGGDTLMNGMRSILSRSLLLTSSPKKSDDEMESLTAAWYDAIIDDIPADYWRDVALWAARYIKPYDKFTIGQFFEAWEMYRQAGKARGYETWRQ